MQITLGLILITCPLLVAKLAGRPGLGGTGLGGPWGTGAGGMTVNVGGARPGRAPVAGSPTSAGKRAPPSSRPQPPGER